MTARLAAVSKRFGARAVLAGLDLEARDGEYLVLLGPSGCGKTSVLRILAGLEVPDAGTVELDGRVVNDPASRVPPRDRNVGMLFQDLALWPHLSVLGNVEFPLAARGVERSARRARAVEALASVGLAGRETAAPARLSGGERQRVALARALVTRPRLLLLDEPLSSVDEALKGELVGLLKDLHRRYGGTVLHVTHGAGEALALAGRIAVLDEGRVAQVGTPEGLYRAPRTRRVARSLGLVDVVPLRRGTREMDFTPGANGAWGAVRPETVELLPPGAGPEGAVEECRFLGDHWLVRVAVGALTLRARSDAPREVGARVALRLREPPVPLEDA
jgi:ABC-type Fe3+/spermidine/putrescine transport system ATPase subunit